MNKEAFKQRMQSLKSYREQNPGKGYWDFKSYEEGGEVPPTNKPTIIEPIPYKGKLYSDRYGRKYTEEQVYDYYNNGTDEIDRLNGLEQKKIQDANNARKKHIYVENSRIEERKI